MRKGSPYCRVPGTAAVGRWWALSLLAMLCMVPLRVYAGELPPIQIAASINPVRAIVEEIGGRYVSVTSVTPPGVDPHTFELVPSVVTRLNTAEVIFINGFAIEFWEKRLDPEVREKVVDLSGAISEKNGDPHTWLDPVIVLNELPLITEALCNARRERCSQFQKNEARFRGEISSFIEEAHQSIGGWKSKTFIAYHPAWTRFALRFGLVQASTIKETEESTPTLSQMRDALSAGKKTGARIIILDPYTPRDALSGFLEDSGLEVVVLDEVGIEGEGYLALLRRNLAVLQGVLAQ